jgi:hypothetical protein
VTERPYPDPPARSAVVIAAHRSGVAFLDRLLASLGPYGGWPIHIVVAQHRASDEPWIESLVARFPALPITVHRTPVNGFELGALHVAHRETDCDEFLLLPQSCEILDPRFFQLVFEEHRGRSVALGLQRGAWGAVFARMDRFERHVIRKHLRADLHDRLLAAGEVIFWQGHLGKYLRTVLDRLDVQRFVPTNMLEAITLSEIEFTSRYHSLDPNTVEIFPGWNDLDGTLVDRHGRTRLRIANDYLIKWKSHWRLRMVVREVARAHPVYGVASRVIDVVKGRTGRAPAGPYQDGPI